MEQAAKDLGAAIEVTGIQRFALGEGIERKDSDFAAEVAAQLKYPPPSPVDSVQFLKHGGAGRFGVKSPWSGRFEFGAGR